MLKSLLPSVSWHTPITHPNNLRNPSNWIIQGSELKMNNMDDNVGEYILLAFIWCSNKCQVVGGYSNFLYQQMNKGELKKVCDAILPPTRKFSPHTFCIMSQISMKKSCNKDILKYQTLDVLIQYIFYPCLSI